MESRKRKESILIVDDEPENIRILAKALDGHYTTMAATSGAEALAHAASKNRPDLILLDIMMRNMDGYQVCRRLTADPATRDIPVIFITSMDRSEDEARGFEAGAVDYITKPFVPAIVEARIRTHMELKRHRTHFESLVKERTRNLEQEIECRKTVEKNLRASELKLSSAIHAFRGFIYTTFGDPPHIVDFMNQPLIDHIGFDGTGGKCHEVIFGRPLPCPDCKLGGLGENNLVEVELEHPKNGIWYNAIHSPAAGGDDHIRRVQTILIDITRWKRAELELKEKKEHLHKENIRLRASMKERYRFGKIIGKSLVMQGVYEDILKASATNAGVIITGESGTGKELVARAVHLQSDRGGKEMISVNCGAVPGRLAESEFFGHKKGAFTGADQNKTGLLSAAHQSSLFLDEVGELGPYMQVKLLRAIEGSGYSPLGSHEVIVPDIRIIAATNRDLGDLVKRGLMRKDFYYRIDVVPIHLPPLRERMEDIPLLVEFFLKEKGAPRLGPKEMETLMGHPWPGNVRELQNTLHRYVTLRKIELTGASHEAPAAPPETEGDPGGGSLAEVLDRTEKKTLIRILNRNGWRRDNTAGALGISPKTLYRRMKHHGLLKKRP